MVHDEIRKLKILLFSAHPPIDSELMSKWLKKGHEVYKVSFTSAWHSQFSLLSGGVKEMVPQSRPDVIICGNLTDTLVSLTLKVFKKWFKTKVVYIHWWYPPRNPLLYLVTNISVCDYERKYLKKLLGIRSGVAYCPVDVEHFKMQRVEKRKKVIAIGNGFKTRAMMGYDHLIEIIKNIHSLDPTIEIGVVGMNDSKDYPDYVEVKSLNKDELLSEISSASSVFFTTTRNLIMNSLQIAMSCESSVVAFDLEPFREVIEDGKSGYLIKLGDNLEFAKRIVEVTNNENPEVGKLARQSIIDKCDSNMVSERILQLAINGRNFDRT